MCDRRPAENAKYVPRKREIGTKSDIQMLTRGLIDYIEEAYGRDRPGVASAFQLVSALMHCSLYWGDFAYHVKPGEVGTWSSTSITMVDPQSWYYLRTGRGEFLQQLDRYVYEGIGPQGAGRCVFMGYDAQRGRCHALTCGASGCLDGPLSPARLSIDDYHAGRHERTWSPDGRFHDMLAGFHTQRIRLLNFAQQMLRTLPVRGCAFTCGESGKLYVVQGSRAEKLLVLSPGPDGQVLKAIAPQREVSLNGLGTSPAVDERHGRLYGTT